MVCCSLAANVYDVTKYGAVGDGKTLDTDSIAKAIAAANSSGSASTVLFPAPGTYLTGTVWLNATVDVALEIASGATVLGSVNPSDYTVLAPLPSYGTGRDIPGPRYSSIIQAFGAVGVRVGGAGVLDGNGADWWARFHNGSLEHSRPHAIELNGCSDTYIGGSETTLPFTVRNSPFWTIHIVYSTRGLTQFLRIDNPTSGAPNTDGWDPDSSTFQTLLHSHLQTGDDGIAIKSGYNQAGIAVGRPTEHVYVHNVTVDNACCNGAAIGSETSGGIANVTLSGVSVVGTPNSGATIKTSKGRGAYIHDVTFEDMAIGSTTQVAFELKTDYSSHCDPPACNASAIPVIYNLAFNNLSSLPGASSHAAGSFIGFSSQHAKNVSFRNININTDQGWTCQNLQQVTVHDVSPTGLTEACS